MTCLRSLWQRKSQDLIPGKFAPELGHVTVCRPAPLRQHPVCRLGPPVATPLHMNTLRPREVKLAPCSGHMAEAGLEQRRPPAVSLPVSWLASWGARDPDSPRETFCPWKGSAQQMLVVDLLLSVEYDEFFPHCLQALLEVSILSKSTERGL